MQRRRVARMSYVGVHTQAWRASIYACMHFSAGTAGASLSCQARMASWTARPPWSRLCGVPSPYASHKCVQAQAHDSDPPQQKKCMHAPAETLRLHADGQPQ